MTRRETVLLAIEALERRIADLRAELRDDNQLVTTHTPGHKKAPSHTTRRVQGPPVNDEVLRLATERGEVTVSDMVAQGINKHSAGMALSDLTKTGLLVRIRRGVYAPHEAQSGAATQ